MPRRRSALAQRRRYGLLGSNDRGTELLLIGGGLVVVGGGLWLFAGNFVSNFPGLLGFYGGVAGRAQPYMQQIQAASAAIGVPVSIIVGIGDHESKWGTGFGYWPQGPGGLGDAGHGHGLMQIDDRTWGSWLASNDWTDPYTNILKGAQIFADDLSRIGDTAMALQAYNGPSSSSAYSNDVLARAATFTSQTGIS